MTNKPLSERTILEMERGRQQLLHINEAQRLQESDKIISKVLGARVFLTNIHGGPSSYMNTSSGYISIVVYENRDFKKVIFETQEPPNVFPTDHLMAQLMLLSQ